MAAITNQRSDHQPGKSQATKRHYRCLCSNYRGKCVDGDVVSLHRFPANKTVQKAWLRRIKLVSPKFHFNEKNDRLCSAHFSGNKYTQGKTLPSVFKLKDGRTKTFSTEVTEEECPDYGSTEGHHDEATDPQDIDNTPVGFSSSDVSVCASVMLHDYCGPVERTSVSNFVDKCEQTCIMTKSTANVSSQTDNFIHKSVSCQTDADTYVKTFRSVGTQVTKPTLVFEDISNSGDKCMFYTGLPNGKTFQAMFDEMTDAEENTHKTGRGENCGTGRPRILRIIDEFLLVLMRLRLGLLLVDLADRFHISKATCSNIVNHWISYLHVKLAVLIPWPSKLIIDQTMPNKFKVRYPSCRVIIDCTEIFTETPQSQANKSMMYSHYKSHMTYKALLGISPSGIITFVSDLWTGSISDKQITERCGILDLCDRGDSIMADKGFLISDLTIPRGLLLIIPPLKRSRFNRRQIEETRRIANLRIDVERAMERVKNFRILQGVMPITIAKQATKIWRICAALSNLQPPLVHDEDF